jgi:Zn-dependent protease
MLLLTFLAEIAHLTHDLAVALYDLVAGRKRRRYQHSVLVRAPQDAVWRAVDADTITLGTIIPMTATTELVAGTEDVYRTDFQIGDEKPHATMTWRQELRREGEALHCRILVDGTESGLVHGPDDRLGYELATSPEGTRLTVFREVTPNGILDAILAPFGARVGARTYKKKIEKEVGAPRTTLERLAASGIVLSLVAFASFCYLWGFQFAATLAVVILLHELGHALAMKLVGMEVKGIYLIPFFGGIAVPKSPYRTDFQTGFVCLMGPGFSLVPTFAFLAAYQIIGGAILYEAALVSAIINLINLLPILPLDGGHVVKSILTAVNRRLANIAAVIGCAAGVFLAWRYETYILGVLVLLVAGGLLFPGNDKDRKELERAPMSGLAAAVLLVGLLATAAGHGYAGYSVYSSAKHAQQREQRATAPATPSGMPTPVRKADASG